MLELFISAAKIFQLFLFISFQVFATGKIYLALFRLEDFELFDPLDHKSTQKKQCVYQDKQFHFFTFRTQVFIFRFVKF
jgi:hypothetical protein